LWCLYAISQGASASVVGGKNTNKGINLIETILLTIAVVICLQIVLSLSLITIKHG
jgi:hypothetical protein